MTKPVYLLALETSGMVGGAALVRDGELIHQVTLEEGLRHGTDLIPAAQACLQAGGLKPQELAAVVVSRGPGSYTGTRIGVMAACSVAYGAGLPVVGVSSLAALAWEARTLGRIIVPFQDARRDEVFTAVYRIGGDRPEDLVCEKEDTALTPEEAVTLAKGDGYALVGSAVGKYEELAYPSGVTVAETPKAPSAASVGLLGFLAYNAGRLENPIGFQPVYLRRDDAPAVFERM